MRNSTDYELVQCRLPVTVLPMHPNPYLQALLHDLSPGRSAGAASPSPAAEVRGCPSHHLPRDAEERIFNRAKASTSNLCFEQSSTRTLASWANWYVHRPTWLLLSFLCLKEAATALIALDLLQCFPAHHLRCLRARHLPGPRRKLFLTEQSETAFYIPNDEV